MNQEEQAASRNWHKQKTDSPLEPLEGSRPADILTLPSSSAGKKTHAGWSHF